MHRIQTGLRQVKYEVLSMFFHFLFCTYTCLFLQYSPIQYTEFTKIRIEFEFTYFDVAKEFCFYVALFDFIPTICILLALQQCIKQVNSVISTTCNITMQSCIFFCLLLDQPCKKCLLWDLDIFIFFYVLYSTSCRHKQQILEVDRSDGSARFGSR